MEREVRRLLSGAIIFGCLFAVAIGIAAGDRGMIQGELVAGIAGMITTPFVARMWR
jgi:hypothetical protein